MANPPAGDKCKKGIGSAMHDRRTCVLHGLREFTADGTFTAPAGVRSVFVQSWGAGGGGGGGGGAGGLVWCAVPVDPGSNYTIDVGGGGTGGAGALGAEGYAVVWW